MSGWAKWQDGFGWWARGDLEKNVKEISAHQTEVGKLRATFWDVENRFMTFRVENGVHGRKGLIKERKGEGCSWTERDFSVQLGTAKKNNLQAISRPGNMTCGLEEQRWRHKPRCLRSEPGTHTSHLGDDRVTSTPEDLLWGDTGRQKDSGFPVSWFIHQIFIQCLLCAESCTGHIAQTGNAQMDE